MMQLFKDTHTKINLKKRLDEIKNFHEQDLDNIFKSNMFYNATVGASASIIWILRLVSSRVTSTLIIL